MQKIMAIMLFSRYFSPAPTCSSGCDAELPTFVFDDCNPKVNFSEIRRVFMANTTMEDFDDWTEAEEWLDRIESGEITVLTVIGDKPAGAPVQKDISNGRKVTIGKDHTLNFTIDDVSDENYEAMRKLECGGKYKMWYETEGEKMFGGPSGVLVTVDVNNVLGRGREEIELINGAFSWRAKFHPERTTSPIYGSGAVTVPTTFDTALTFVSSTTDADAAVTGEAAATNANLKFEFNAVPGAVGTPADMSVTVGGVEKVTITYPSEYAGHAFKLTNTDNTVHTGHFTSPTAAV